MPDRPAPAHLPELGTSPVKLIVADIDGCLSAGAGSPFDMELLTRLAWANAHSRTDDTVPAVTLCTGRSQPYVECLLQAIGGYHPAVCESGTVFFFPRDHTIVMHPGFDQERALQLEELRHRVAHRMMRPNINAEPGKISHLTMIIQPPDTAEGLYDLGLEIAAEFGDTFVVELTRKCVHFLFRDLHKGTGLTWLSEETGIAMGEMVGIGDAAPDLPFLSQVGFAYAPANAHADVKKACHRVSKRQDSGAALELLDMAVAHNRFIKTQSVAPSEEAITG